MLSVGVVVAEQGAGPEVASVDELVVVGVSLSLQLSCWESDLTATEVPPRCLSGEINVSYW